MDMSYQYNHHTPQIPPCKEGNRIDLLKDYLRTEHGVALFLTSEVNRFYLTRSHINSAVLIVTEQEAVLLTDFRFYEQALTEARNCRVVMSQDLYGDGVEYLRSHDIEGFQVEKRRMTVAEMERLKFLCQGKTEISDESADAILDEMRKIKSEEEADCFRKAQAITDESFTHILNFIRTGVTETDIKMELGTHMVKLGSENYGMNFITVCGFRTSLPHGAGGNAVVKDGDFVMMDFGGKVGGYSADMTRTVAVGHVTDEMAKVYETVRKAQEKAVAGLNAGVRGVEVDRIARDYIYSQGYEGCFGHGLGHSLGLEIHEDPRCNETCQEILRPGMMMTVEPGIYLKGRFGVRIEDMGLVTENGFEVMTTSSRELLIL